jgi:tripartite-type tricarboxylate transporter receptor subunit TctC
MKKALCYVVFMALAFVAFAGGSGEYPTRNIETIVGFSAGGTTDLITRGLYSVAQDNLPKGITFVVSNVAGNAGINGFTKFLSAKADGYTLGIVNIDMAINYNLGRTNVSMDDYIPLAISFYDPYGLIVDKSPNYSNFKEFIEYAKAHPKQVIMGHSGIGAAPHIIAASIEQHFGVQFKYVTYGSTGDCITAIMSGQINGTVGQTVPAVSQIKSGSVRLLTMLTTERAKSWPDTPAASEIYPDFQNRFIAWGFCVCRKDTPPEIVKFLQDILEKARSSNAYAEVQRKLGMDPVTLNISQANEFLQTQYSLYKELTKDMKF